MNIRRSICIILLSLLLNSTVQSAPTTWAPVEVVCPVCQTKNTFLEIMSYGNYIYMWPSKYQLIFWPYTDSPVLYSCKRCHLTTFMEEFKGIPKDKLPTLKKILQQVNLPKADKYTDIPMSQRLFVAEKVYSELGRGDEFWSHFYRVLGFHLEEEKKQEEAREARKKALTIVERMLTNKENEGIRKELLLISGAMRFFLKDGSGALKDFNEASGLKYQNKSLKPEQSENADKYLSSILAEYIKIINEKKTPQNDLATIKAG